MNHDTGVQSGWIENLHSWTEIITLAWSALTKSLGFPALVASCVGFPWQGSISKDCFAQAVERMISPLTRVDACSPLINVVES